MERGFRRNVSMPEPLHGLDFWHGVSDPRAGARILQTRTILPRSETGVHRRGFTASVVDHVYITYKLFYALIYARGHASLGPCRGPRRATRRTCSRQACCTSRSLPAKLAPPKIVARSST